MDVDPRKLHSISQVAKRSPYSEPMIRKLINEGPVHAVRIAGRIFIEEAELIKKLPSRYTPRSAK